MTLKILVIGVTLMIPLFNNVTLTQKPSSNVPLYMYGGNKPASAITPSTQQMSYMEEIPTAENGYTTDGSGRATGPSYNVQEAANTRNFYQGQIDQLNHQNSLLDNQEQVGLGNILSSFNRSANRLDQQRADAKTNYDTSVQDNNRSYLNTRGGIMNNVRANANALQRLLGLAGSGNSSAAYEQAPYAAARQGTQNLDSAQQTYGLNSRNLDTSWNRTERDYKNNYSDLETQKFQQENSLRASIKQTRAGLLDKIAQATGNRDMAGGASYAQAKAAMDPYTAQVNDLLAQIVSLGNQYASPVLRTSDIAYSAPDLNQYSLGGGKINAPGAAGNIDETFAPVIAPQERDEYGNVIA